MNTKAGIDIKELSAEVTPQDDLFGHVNGKWLDKTEIPPDKSTYGSFQVLAEEAEIAVRSILESLENAASEEQKKVASLYKSFMDEATIESLGSSPIEHYLLEVEAIDSVGEFLKYLGTLQTQGVTGIFQIFIDTDPGNPDRYMVLMEQSGISLPDEQYFREEHFGPVREAHVSHVATMFELAHLSNSKSRAKRVAELEKAIASFHWDNVKCRDSIKTYNIMTWDELSQTLSSNTSEFDLSKWLDGFQPPEGSFNELVVRQPSFVSGLASLFAQFELQDWKDWLSWHIIHAAAPYLDSRFVEENFNFYGKTLSGAKELRERWKRGISLVEGLMGDAIGKIYVKTHFPTHAKEKMDTMITHLLEAYRQSIEELDWMSESTKKRALEKLSKFVPKIGYPANWKDYSSLEINQKDLWSNVLNGSRWLMQRELHKLGKPVDRSEWFMTPQTVNAYYNPSFNEIVFPAAILQFPFYDPDRDDAANYGAIGAVIGHEIGHGFDDQGAHYDGDGRLSNWWSDADREAFQDRTEGLIRQYDALYPRQTPDHHVNGALTVGENIGDLGGLGIAWKAYQIALDGSETPIVDGLSGAQRFFLSWARSWQEKQRNEEMLRRLATDPHSPVEFRCNQVVRNLDIYYQAFSVSPKDKMWLEPTKRIQIW